MADVNVTIGVDGKAAVSGLKQVGDEATKSEGSLKKMGGALGDVAKIAGGFIVAEGLMKLPGLISGFIGGASDLNESLSKVNVVFGAQAKEIDDWSPKSWPQVAKVPSPILAPPPIEGSLNAAEAAAAAKAPAKDVMAKDGRDLKKSEPAKAAEVAKKSAPPAAASAKKK